MSKKQKDSGPRGYHHGDLRQALLDAALALVEGGERQALSVRTVAARAGVSAAAPYRHFEDREALLAAVATIGFDRLLKAVAKARASATADSRLNAMGSAYLKFASQNRGLYQLMFTENHFIARPDKALAKSSTNAFLELENEVRSHLKSDRKATAKLVATTIWATLHGSAMLAFERLIPAGGPSDEHRAWAMSAEINRLIIQGLVESRW